MSAYYNPYSTVPLYPATYQYPQVQQSIPAPQQGRRPIEWVEGEVGAKAFQMPSDLTPNQAIPLWDSTDTVIYLKSWNQIGMPNPLQKLRYEIVQEQNTKMLQSGSPSPDLSNYATHEDIEDLRNEIKQLINQNGNKSVQATAKSSESAQPVRQRVGVMPNA